MKNFKKFTMATLVLGSLGLTACSTTTPTNTASNSIKMTTFGELTTLDSVDYNDVPTSDMIGQVFEGLYRVAPNNKIELGMAASEPVISEDGLVYTFTLKDNVKWSNGQPVTAPDFVYTYRKLVDPAEAKGIQSAEVFKNASKIAKGELPVEELGVKAIDNQTLEITLEYPAPYLPKLLTGTRFLPQSVEFASAEGANYGTSANDIVSNGPYLLKGWNGSEVEWQLVKNPDYWDSANVSMDEITVNVSKEVATSTTLFDAGEVQYTAISDNFVDQYKSRPEFHTQPKAMTGYMSFNVLREVTGNVHFRRAIAMAYDKEALVTNVMKDGSTVLNGIVPANFGFNDDSGEDFRDASGDVLAYDVVKAQAEWELAKKDLDVDSVEVTLLTSDTGTSKLVGEYLQAQIQQNLPGVTLNIKSVPLKNRLELEKQDDFDIFYGTWTPDYQDPMNFLEQYTTTGGINFANYSNANYDTLITDIQTNLATDAEKRFEKMIEAEHILAEDAIVAPIYQGAQSYLLAPNVKGLLVTPFGRSVDLRLVTVQ
ncbi:oligopeptide transport system substrate-binding protein [Granulicatella balaenopterae]|uniref:Oligopeptide transport system substrate-binding protein n=1 Tax=Granulicatella balaenopterae TaxID=137733 RepID=A0A1H9I308_9LACT|nr:peptide ABC transporter substrate-binding protein [Granulicatella balaenopterae]SEQ68990.1 oligopeptide transport system substrate-binding protein [Granulicatella balaenopterae]